MNRGPLWNSIRRVFTLQRRWYIVAAFWRGTAGRVDTRQESRRICHFTLGGNLSRVTIVPHNRQEVVKHIILTHWALWHGQFYCCHGGRKETLSHVTLSWDRWGCTLFFYFSIRYLYSFSFHNVSLSTTEFLGPIWWCKTFFFSFLFLTEQFGWTRGIPWLMWHITTTGVRIAQ